MINRRHPDPRRNPDDRRVADRRDAARHAFERSVRFLRSGTPAEQVLHGELLDVSVTGIRIRLEEPLQPADTLLVEVRDEQSRCYNLSAEVVWVEHDADGQHVGCELRVELTPKQFKLLREVASGELANGELST